jgi:hypothetical protein
MPRKSMLIAGAALFAAVAAGGSAYTASNTVPDATVGYGTNTVSGGTVNAITYNANATGDNIDTVTLVMAGDTTSSAVSIGFNGNATTSCGTGTFSSTNSETTYTCDNGGVNFTQSTSSLTSTAVLVN